MQHLSLSPWPPIVKVIQLNETWRIVLRNTACRNVCVSGTCQGRNCFIEQFGMKIVLQQRLVVIISCQSISPAVAAKISLLTSRQPLPPLSNTNRAGFRKVKTLWSILPLNFIILLHHVSNPLSSSPGYTNVGITLLLDMLSSKVNTKLAPNQKALRLWSTLSVGFYFFGEL